MTRQAAYCCTAASSARAFSNAARTACTRDWRLAFRYPETGTGTAEKVYASMLAGALNCAGIGLHEAAFASL